MPTDKPATAASPQLKSSKNNHVSMTTLSLGGLVLSPASHCIALSTENQGPQDTAAPTFDDIDQAGQLLAEGLANLSGRRLQSIPDSRLQMNVAFHAMGGAAGDTQSRVPICIGFSRSVSSRFEGLEEKMNPFQQEGHPAFAFRVVVEGPHGAFLSASSPAFLTAAVEFFIQQFHESEGNLVCIDHLEPIV